MRLSPLCLPLPPLTASTASGSCSRILEGQNTKLPEYQNEVWPAWARLPDYKTTRPPLSLLNVSKGLHCILKSALVPPKTAPHTLSQNGASFLESVFFEFLEAPCVVPVMPVVPCVMPRCLPSLLCRVCSVVPCGALPPPRMKSNSG